MVMLAANSDAMEKNAEAKMNFMLHASKKSAKKWKDLPIPFPREPGPEEKRDISGISQLPSHINIYRPEGKNGS